MTTTQTAEAAAKQWLALSPRERKALFIKRMRQSHDLLKHGSHDVTGDSVGRMIRLLDGCIRYMEWQAKKWKV
jgi:hypothetical protein